MFALLFSYLLQNLAVKIFNLLVLISSIYLGLWANMILMIYDNLFAIT